MDARFVTLTAKPGQAAALAAFWDAAVLAQITAQPGSRGFYVLTDVASDRVVALSLWDSEADVDATAQVFRSHMAAVAQLLAGPPVPQAMHVQVATSAPVAA